MNHFIAMSSNDLPIGCCPINRSGVPERDLEALAWAIRWVVLGTLVDRRTDLDETRERLRALIEGYAPGERREERPKPQAV